MISLFKSHAVRKKLILFLDLSSTKINTATVLLRLMRNKKIIVSYLYINGLGSGSRSFLDYLIDTWWSLNDKNLIRFPVNWYAVQSLDELIASVSRKVDLLLKKSDRVVIIGSSAGGSLAINVLCAKNTENLLVVTSRSRIKRGVFRPNKKKSLEFKARKSRLFYECVLTVQRNIDQLTNEQKNRILILTPLTDQIVPIQTMLVNDITTHVSITFGHFGGYLAHMIADISLIDRFVRSKT